MAGDRLVLRTASPDDVDELVRLETDCWPEALAADSLQIEARIAAYRDGQWVAELDGQLLGYSSAQRIAAELLQGNRLNYETVTDGDRFTDTHDDNGEIYQLVGVSSHPASRGQGIGRQLVDLQVERAWTLDGIHRVLGFTRPSGRHLEPHHSLTQYLDLHSAGSQPDRTLAFHLDAGAFVVSHHENFRPQDLQCLGAGVLIEYPR
jgi:GNAT superfamily N-acetyltransferase